MQNIKFGDISVSISNNSGSYGTNEAGGTLVLQLHNFSGTIE
jgi:hypothetical protein